MNMVNCLMLFFREEERMVLCYLTDKELGDWVAESFDDTHDNVYEDDSNPVSVVCV